MSRLSVEPGVVESAGKPLLLPVERLDTVNGVEKMVKNVYAAEIASAREHTSKGSGKLSLKLKLAIDQFFGEELGVQRIYIEDYLSYEQKAVFKLAKVVGFLGLSPKSLDTDDFEGKFLKVTIRHEEFTPTRQDGTAGEVQIDNKIDEYIDVYIPETPSGDVDPDKPF